MMYFPHESNSRFFSSVERLEPRRLYSAAVVSSAALSAVSGLVLPDLPGYSAPSSNPALPSGVETFTPPVQAQTAVAGAPAIATSSLTADSGDTVALTGASFTNDAAGDFADTRAIVYGQTSATDASLTYAPLQSTSTDGVLATIPSSEPHGSMYLVWMENSTGIGTPVAVNQTQAQWMEPTTAAPSTTVSVYGRNLDNGSGSSWVYLQPATGAGEWAAVTNANAYRVQFTLPANLTPGSNYQVWVHNGLGGNYGWSTPLNLTVGVAQTWTTTVNVKAFGATGDGSTNDGPAIQMALNSLSFDQTLYFPAGTYRVDGEQLLLPSNVRIEGAGKNASTIRFDGSLVNIGLGPFDIGVRDIDNARNIDFESIGLIYNGPTAAEGSVVRERFATNMTFNNVLVTGNSINAIDWEYSTDLQLTNSTVIAERLYINGSQQIVLDNDSLLQTCDNYGEAGVSFDNSSDISVTNCTTENYYDYELSVNPDQPYDPNAFGEGRFMEFMRQISNVYVASNESIDLGESATPADHNSGEQINVEGAEDLAYGAVVSATANSFTLAGNDYSLVVGLNAIVTSGSGLGQQRIITTVSYDSVANTTTYAIGKSFSVIPETGSNIDVAAAPSNMVFYQNTLNHTTGALAGEDQASSGFVLFNGGTGIVLDSNTVNNTRTGVSMWSYNVHLPVSYTDIVNNSFNGVQAGISLAPDERSDPNFIAVAIRDNNVSGASTSYAAATVGINLHPFYGQAAEVSLTIAELNAVTGFPVGLQAGDDPTALASQNSFSLGTQSYGGSSGISFATASSNLLLQGNTYSGYQAAYGGSIPDSVITPSFSAESQTFSDYQAPSTSQDDDSPAGAIGGGSSDGSDDSQPSGGVAAPSFAGGIAPPSAAPTVSNNVPADLGSTDNLATNTAPVTTDSTADITDSSSGIIAAQPSVATQVQYTDYGDVNLEATTASSDSADVSYTIITPVPNGNTAKAIGQSTPATTPQRRSAAVPSQARKPSNTAPQANLPTAEFVDDSKKKTRLSLIQHVEDELASAA